MVCVPFSCGASLRGGGAEDALSRTLRDGDVLLPRLNLPTIPSQQNAGLDARQLLRWRRERK